jgi:hypothetical protein
VETRAVPDSGCVAVKLVALPPSARSLPTNQNLARALESSPLDELGKSARRSGVPYGTSVNLAMFDCGTPETCVYAPPTHT